MQKQPSSQVTQTHNPHIISAYYRDDEISLVDLWITIARRKKLVLGVTGVVLFIGILVAIALPKEYTYTTGIQIGSYWLKKVDEFKPFGEFTPLDLASNLKTKLEEIYIPEITTAESKEQPLEVKVKTLKEDDSMIIISSKAPISSADRVRKIHEGLVKAITSEHNKLLDSMRQIYETQLESLKREAATIDPSASTTSELLILLDRKRHIDELTIRIEAMLPTHAHQIATRSVQPSTPGKTLIITLAGFLGLFAGLIAVFIAEFRDKVLERMAEQAEESASA